MRSAKTLCGLRVAMVIQPEPVSAALHLVSDEPSDHVLCGRCSGLKESVFRIKESEA